MEKAWLTDLSGDNRMGKIFPLLLFNLAIRQRLTVGFHAQIFRKPEQCLTVEKL
jgi:hypothetical protein